MKKILLSLFLISSVLFSEDLGNLDNSTFNQDISSWEVSGFELAIDYANFSLNSGLQSSNLPKFK